jgi:hypothetical protein
VPMCNSLPSMLYHIYSFHFFWLPRNSLIQYGQAMLLSLKIYLRQLCFSTPVFQLVRCANDYTLFMCFLYSSLWSALCQVIEHAAKSYRADDNNSTSPKLFFQAANWYMAASYYLYMG